MRLTTLSAKDSLIIESVITAFILKICVAKPFDKPLKEYVGTLLFFKPDDETCANEWIMYFPEVLRKRWTQECPKYPFPDENDWGEFELGSRAEWAQGDNMGGWEESCNKLVEGVSEKIVLQIVGQRIHQYLLLAAGKKVEAEFSEETMCWTYKFK